MTHVILRRKPGHLTLLAIITLVSVAVIFFSLGFFVSEFHKEEEEPTVMRCLKMTCTAPNPKSTRKKHKPIWEERLCTTPEDCIGLSQQCLKHIFRDDLFMPESKCTIQPDPSCSVPKKLDTKKFSLDAVDLIGGRWKKPPKTRDD